jgi:ABC-type uncharacterized transport system involved in gliding motility auxiliary subunit
MENPKVKVALYIVIAAVLFFTVNLIASLTLTKYDIDLTEDRLFTLSAGSKNILKDIKEPITIRFFFSNKLASGIPIVKSYAARIRGVLDQYVSNSNGKITLKMIDPEPFSDDEDAAVSYGVKGMEVDQMGTKVYFGMSATNSVDETRVIPFFALEREKFLEYEIARTVYDLANPKKKKIGTISSIQMGSAPLMGIPGLGGSSWLIVQQLAQVFDIKDMDAAKVTKIPDDIDVLMVVQPKGFTPEALYAIDQYVLKGGNVVVFADPDSESVGVNADEKTFSEEFNVMLKSWGVEMDRNKVVADRMAARKYEKGNDDPNKFTSVDYLAWLNLTESNINRDDVTTSMLKSIYMNTAGSIEIVGGEGLEITPLIKSNKKAMKVLVGSVLPTPDPNKLLREFVSDNKEYPLAVRIAGSFKSAFPQMAGNQDYIAASTKPGNIILVADTDMLRDETWAKTQEYQGYKLVTTTSDNAGFVTNALDNLSGTSDLIGLRGRGASKRPFTKVEQLQHEAEERYLSKEQELKDKLANTENKLGSLQQMAKAEAGNELAYKAEQQEEIRRFSDDTVKIKKELRQVQGELRKGIENLGSIIKFINIWLMPLLVMAFAVFLLVMKNSTIRRYKK